MKLIVKHIIQVLTVGVFFLIISCDSKNEFSTLEKRGVALNFAVKEAAVQENNGNGVQIDIAFLAATLEAGTITIEINPQDGLVYDTDFTTNPDGSSGEILIDIPVGSTTASFKVFPKSMPGEDSVKRISFHLSNAMGGVFVGTQQDFTLYITDEPIILINNSLSGFGDVEQGFTSASQSYTITVVSLMDAVVVTAPANFELSLNDTSFSSSLSLAASAFTNGQATIYVRFAPDTNAPLGASNGSITHSSTGAANKTQAVAGNTIAPIPTIIVNESLTDFGNVPPGEKSASQNYTIEGHALTNDITITAPTNFEVSDDDVTFSSEIVIDYTSVEGTPTTVYIRFAPTIVADISEDILHTSVGATPFNLTVTGTGEDPSVLIAYTSFEEPPLGAEYVDTFNNDVDHDLVNHPGESFVDFTSAGGEMGYDATYKFTRPFTTPVPMNANGVVDELTDVGAFTDGMQGYKMKDTDGRYILTFDAIDITGFSTVTITLDFFLNENSYEVSSYSNGTVDVADAIRIYVVVDGGLEIDIFNETSAPGGNLDDDALVLKDIWQTFEVDLSGYTTATLVMESDTNATNEGFWVDNVKIKGLN